MMNLFIVTYDLDYTQFLVDAKNESEAIDLAIEQNINEAFLGKWDNEEDAIAMHDHTNYTVEPINDFDLICNLIKRDDWLGYTPNVMIFRG